MPSVQLNRLSSQISAVTNHFENGEEFQRNLLTLLEMYSDQKVEGKNWLKSQSSMQELHIPPSVIVELDAKLVLTARQNPESALLNSDLLWATDIYELKRAAITLLAGLSGTYQEQVIERISRWINPEIGQRLMKEILTAFEKNSGILLNSEWVTSLAKWLSSNEDELQQLGLKAISHTIQMNYHNLPQVFNLLTPVIRNLHISIHKEMTEVVRALVNLSEAETASFLIMAGTLYPENEVRAFIRKCLPLFDPYFQSLIRSSFS